MRTAILAERIKATRRGDLLLAALVALLVTMSAAGRPPEKDWELASGYSATILQFSLMNAVVMPLTMAALASRLWDMETKGNGCRLLFTLQSRESVFAAKALRGLAQNAVICLVEGAAFLLVGRAYGYTQPLEIPRLLWLLICTFAVNAMLFFALLLLSVRSGTQVLPLSAGLACSLLSVFTAFMPERMTVFTPWAYYLPLGAMRMDYDRATRITTFEALPLPWGLLAVTVICGVLGYLLSRRAVRSQEV